MNVPYDNDAEQALLGVLLLHNERLEGVSRALAPGDFYVPAHHILYAAMLELWGNGEAADSVTVLDVVRRDGLIDRAGGPVLATVLANAGYQTSTDRYVSILIDHASRRRLMQLGAELQHLGSDLGDVDKMIEVARQELSQVGTAVGAPPPNLWGVDDFMDRPPSVLPQWIIPGLIREGWRILLVAEEGVGKSLIAQQICLAAAQGLHPFTLTEIPPVRTLLVDCENPDDRLMAGFNLVSKNLLHRSNYERNAANLWWVEEGIDIRSRVHRSQLEAAIVATRPRLVALGPLYKVYQPERGEPIERAITDVMRILDDLRKRYKITLFMEHHAPLGSNGFREMRPIDSSLWMRWPDYGIAIMRDPERNKDGEDRVFKVGRFRRPRGDAVWPDWLERDGMSLPWAASGKSSDWMRVANPPQLAQPDDSAPF